MCRIRRKQFSSIYITTLVEKFAITEKPYFFQIKDSLFGYRGFHQIVFFPDNLDFPHFSNTGFPRFFTKISISRIFSNTGSPRFFSHLHWLAAAGGEGYSVRLSSLGWSRCAVSRVNCSTWAARYSGNGFSAVSLNSNSIWSKWRAIHKKMKIMLENGKASLCGNRDFFAFALRTWRFREKTYFRFR
jgi:hypothetical protein